MLEQNIPRELLYIADEVFLTGTAAEITPVRSVDKITVGEGKRGPITERLQKLFFGLFDGATVDRWNWLEPIAGEQKPAASIGPSRSEDRRPRFKSMSAQSLFEKVWASHVVAPETDDTPAVLYVDLHLIHEVTTPQAFDVLRSRGLEVRRPDALPRDARSLDADGADEEPQGSRVVSEPAAAKQVRQMEKNCKDFGIELRGFESRERGIVHVIGPELGATQPGMTIVCGDSHTSTHGAFGALAFGIGTTEVGHVLATQCLLQRKPKTLAINLERQARRRASPRRT